MKRFVLVVLTMIVAAGCSSAVITKSFKVRTDPPDAAITVLSGPELNALKFKSPATIIAEEPTDPALAARAVLEVSKDAYITRTIALRDIKDGQTLNIKLEKINQVRYRLSYRLVSPAQSDTLQFRDSNLSVSFAITDQAFQMRFENLTTAAVKILWDRAQYTDARDQPYKLMHSGIRFQDRNNPIPDQVVQPRAILQEALFPIRNVVVTGGRPPYDIKKLLTLDSEAAGDLKGKALTLFIPVEVNRAIIPYSFKIQIFDAVREDVAK